METTGSLSNTERAETPPLTIPNEVWQPLPPDQKAIWRRAGRVLDHLVVTEQNTVSDLRMATGLEVEEVFESLRALAGMNLVEFENDGVSFVAKLIAVPDEHVRVVGPDGKARWLFIARPLVAPEVDPADLN